jgi:probable phosphoglycerate mutase
MGESTGQHDLWLVRHGETEWARLGRHTSRTDIPLTPNGREQAAGLSERLAGHAFALVLTSPMSRARDTAALAGFPDAIPDPDLREWDYGDFEGRTTKQIEANHPGWLIWTGPWPGGETPEAVAVRADRVIARTQAANGDSLVFAHGHFLRVIAARWLGLPAAEGGIFALETATISVLGWEHDRRVIDRWNDVDAPEEER